MEETVCKKLMAAENRRKVRKFLRFSYPLLIRLGMTLSALLFSEFVLKHISKATYEDWALSSEFVVIMMELFLTIWGIRSFGEEGALAFPKPKLRYLLAVLACYFLLPKLLGQFWQLFPGHIPANEAAINAGIAAASIPTRMLFLITLSFLGPILEELLFREAMMNLYFKGSRFFLDVLIQAILFSWTHVFLYPWSWIDFASYLILGLVFGFLYRYTKSVYYTILLHIAWNLTINWAEIYNLIYWNILN